MNNGHKDVDLVQAAENQTLSNGNGRPPTSADVGKLAGVSRSTVSLVLNQVPNRQITTETRERVLAAAKQLGYVPHAAASALRGGHSNLILIPFFNRPDYYTLNVYFDELAKRLAELGYLVMFHRDLKESGPEVVSQWASLRPIGLISESHRLDDEAKELLYKSGTRAILAADAAFTNQDGTRWSDNTGVVAAQHLITAGHHQLGVIVPRDPDYYNLGLERLRVVEQFARSKGVNVERIDLAFDRQDAFILAQRWRRNPHPTGVFAFNDEYAVMLMGALQDQGIAIPQDVAIVGCDNLRICEFLRPRLTSISTHSGIFGRALAERFHAMITGQPYQMVKRAEPTLFVRDSA